MGIECCKAIVLHDYFEYAEGGGRLSKILADGLPADLGYGFKVDQHPFFAGSSSLQKEIRVSSFTNLPLWRQIKLTRDFRKCTGFLTDYQDVVYSGFYTPLAVGHHLKGKNVLYCHTPPRFLYDQRDFFFARIPIWQHPFLEAFNRYFQPRYERAVSRMDVVIANSINVQQRIKKYLGCNAKVVHPPCDLERFRWKKKGDFFLSTARLDPLKRVDLVVKAFRKMNDRKLVVVSGGPELKRIRRLAAGADNIEVLGWVDEQLLQSLLSTCLATIYIPKDEDFGMSPVESMAAGKPVIGVAEGGLLETLVDGETARLIPSEEVKVESLCHAVNGLTRSRAGEMREACEKRARMFGREIFTEKMKQVIAAEENGCNPLQGL